MSLAATVAEKANLIWAIADKLTGVFKPIHLIAGRLELSPSKLVYDNIFPDVILNSIPLQIISLSRNFDFLKNVLKNEPCSLAEDIKRIKHPIFNY